MAGIYLDAVCGEVRKTGIEIFELSFFFQNVTLNLVVGY